MGSTMRQRDGELILFWTLPLVAIIWVSAFLLFPGFVHPMSPAMSAQEVAAFYRDPENLPRIRYSMVVFNWFAVGTHTGLLDPPGLAPTGKRVEFDVREIAEIRDGLVSRVRLVVDMAAVMRQLGMLPAPGTRGERAFAMMQRLQMKLSRR